MIIKDMRPSTKFAKSHFSGEKLMCVEIGVKAGANSLSILQNLPIKFLYMIDPMKAYLSRNQKTVNKYLNTLREDVIDRYDNCCLIKQRSFDAHTLIPNELDFVYIDGDHEYSTVIQDIHLYYPKVRDGGILAGHDYNCEKYPGVKKAVDELVTRYGYKLLTQFSEFPSPHKAAWDWWLVK